MLRRWNLGLDFQNLAQKSRNLISDRWLSLFCLIQTPVLSYVFELNMDDSFFIQNGTSEH